MVGRNFERLRKQKGFTQEKFAEASGFTQQYISGLERGRRNPTIVTLFELATTLGVSHIDLVLPDDESRSDRCQTLQEKVNNSILIFSTDECAFCASRVRKPGERRTWRRMSTKQLTFPSSSSP